MMQKRQSPCLWHRQYPVSFGLCLVPGGPDEEPGSNTPSQVYDDRPAKGRGTYMFDDASLGADSLPAGASPPRQRPTRERKCGSPCCLL